MQIFPGVTINPAQCGGRPCVRGMRIRVSDVVALLASGLTPDEIMSEMSDLTAEDISACIRFAAQPRYLLSSIAPLGFHEEWFTLGVITEAQYGKIIAEYEASDDKNAEHYRYAALRNYIKANHPLSTEKVRRLYYLAEGDPDLSMSGAVMIELVCLPECPDDILDDAIADTARRHLSSFATRSKERRAGG